MAAPIGQDRRDGGFSVKTVILALRRRFTAGVTSRPLWPVASVAGFVLLAAGAFAVGNGFGEWRTRTAPQRELERLAIELRLQRADIETARAVLDGQVGALAERVGMLSAQLVRLDALGERLTGMARLGRGEFDFSGPPALGGPALAPRGAVGRGPAVPSLESTLDALATMAADRARQLDALEAQILARELTRQILPGGRPVLGGYVSSYFGDRIDPFTGSPAFHSGLDFAGMPGSQVLAVATGVVSIAGPDGGYGQLVELTHGNGYVTRYGHNERLLVSVGQTVRKGEPLALIGSTGRSTGPHLHFEVLRNGAPVDPLSFIGR